MRWKEHVGRPVVSVEEAAAMVQAGDRIAMGLPEAVPFLLALASREELHDVTVMTGVAAPGAVAAALHPGIRVMTAFASPFSRDAIRAGTIEFLPLSFHAGAAYIDRFAPRVGVVVVSEPQPDGTVFPGGVLAYNDAIVRRDRAPGDIVLGVVDPAQPRIPGDAFRVEDFDAFVDLPPATPATQTAMRETSEHAGAIAVHLSELIPDGATIQAGVGGIPDDALSMLTDKRDLGIHTEVLGPGLVSLIQAGVATGVRKSVHRGLATFTICEPSVWSFAHEHRGMQLLGARACLDPRAIAANVALRCVNSAVEIDLLGQVNAEVVRGMQFSGVGGQLDFFRACRLAGDALSILVMESTAASGTASRVVPRLGEGHVVTSSRYDVDVVITEHGIAWLRDRTTRERAKGLIDVAAPAFRGELTEAAARLGLLTR